MEDSTKSGGIASGRVTFGSGLGFVLVTSGSAVGLGNIWRFPFIVGENGGGVFLLPYFISVIVIGIPIMVVEMSAGRASGGGIVATFASLSRRASWLGVMVALAALALLSYYLVVTGWALGYMTMGLAGIHPRFSEFTSGANSVLFFLLALAITAAVVSLGVNRGIEALSKVLMPTLVLLILGLAAYSMTLPGRDEALRFYLTPEPSALLSPTVWIRSLGQAFFSVGVGMGVLTTYGAYVSRGTNLVRSSAIVAGVDTFIALLAGLIVFPIAFSFGSEPGSGPELAFETLPRAFEGLGAGVGYVLAVLFYTALSVAALTSAVSLLETVTVGLQEVREIAKRRSLAIVLTFVVILGLPSALSYSGLGWQIFGRRVLDVMDTVVGTFGLPVGVFVTAVVLSWRGADLVAEGLESRGMMSRIVIGIVRWVVPVAIGLLLTAMALEVVRHRVIPQGG